MRATAAAAVYIVFLSKPLYVVAAAGDRNIPRARYGSFSSIYLLHTSA